MEKEFSLYQIHNKDLTSSGIITGYYEPLLEGSLKYGGKYLYPVYGVPDDLLYLDSRILATTKSGDAVNATLQGRNVVRNSYSGAPRGAVGKRYVLDLGDTKPDIRDKKFRVRIDGDRIVPYYTRAEIEHGALTKAPIIAWVDNAAGLYSMQVQGSGKVRLPNGEIVRVAYAEQNGRPFLPPLRKATRGDLSLEGYPLIRGMPIDLSEPSAEDDIAATSGSIVDNEVRTRGMETPSDARKQEPPVAPEQNQRNNSPEVARVIDILLQQQRTHSDDTVKGVSRVAQDPKSEYTGTGGRKTSAMEPLRPGRFGPPAKLSAFSSDPSYVFFRKIPDSESGPIGALGVPLTAGRSVAVDPRTTPLGYPVFISTERSSTRNRFNRLMFAQDTGGAIRGAVRADYFWGFGAKAGEFASRMKDDGRMWLLLPKDQPLPAARAGNGTRGATDAEAGEAECVVQDPQLCVE